MRDKWNDKNGVREGSITSGILFNFYLNEVISDIFKLLVGCTLICSKVNILSYSVHLVLVAPAAQSLQALLKTLSFNLYTPSLKVILQKSCNIFIRHGRKNVSTNSTMNNKPLRQVMETTYLGVALTHDLSCAKDVERAKIDFLNNSILYI